MNNAATSSWSRDSLSSASATTMSILPARAFSSTRWYSGRRRLDPLAPRLAALAYGDGRIIALLAMRPLRRRNLAGLILGRTRVQPEEGWTLRFSGEDTKTRGPIKMPWPALLAPALEHYLAVHRPVLAALRSRWARPVDDALWVSSHGSPMTQMAIYDQIRQRTTEGLGKAVNPHLFRDAAATTMAVEDAQHVQLATPLLGHRQGRGSCG